MLTRFHKYRGINIVLLEEDTVALRETGFGYGLTFRAKPLVPGEAFLVEIERTELGWSGHMRIGLTMFNPQAALRGERGLPQYAFPDLANTGTSWIFPILESQDTFLQEQENLVPSDDDDDRSEPRISVLDEEHIGCTPPRTLSENDTPLGIQQDVGSRVGVMFLPYPKTDCADPDLAKVHFIVNGEDQGLCAKAIPYTQGPLHAVVDVYGSRSRSRKQVKIMQLYGLHTLQLLCKNAILQNLKNRSVETLPLPKIMKEYLLS